MLTSFNVKKPFVFLKPKSKELKSLTNSMKFLIKLKSNILGNAVKSLYKGPQNLRK